ncbi:MAG TPA: energy transducer TonB [Candidatus Angelobacter sp.]|nr:energy transducer TonB [Candidatus Angelobacter sp.]
MPQGLLEHCGSMAFKRFLILPAFMLVAGLALAQTDQPAKPDQAKPAPSPQAEQQAKPDQTQPAQPPKPIRIRISSGIASSLKIKDVTPIYPDAAKQKGIEGDVILVATINTDGTVENLRVVQGNPILTVSALDAVRQWKYKPYILNGKPAEAETTIKIQFHMK